MTGWNVPEGTEPLRLHSCDHVLPKHIADKLRGSRWFRFKAWFSRVVLRRKPLTITVTLDDATGRIDCDVLRRILAAKRKGRA